MATMVWCNSCKTVVWAYDHINQDARGLLNLMSIPCPNCGKEGNFDGWNKEDAYKVVTEAIVSEEIVTGAESQDRVYDDWSALKAVAQRYQVEWKPSPDNRWFKEGQVNL